MAIGIVTADGARLKVIGVGGGGGNAINNMIRSGLENVDFIAANTDKQALDHNLAKIKIQLGNDTTRGLGAGTDPMIGLKAVEESSNDLKDALKGSDMVFVTAGMGGGTGTGGAPIIAKIAREIGALVVGIVTKPFKWEGKKRQIAADEGISQLRENVDSLIVIPNQRLLDIIDIKTSFADAFKKVDEVLYNATRGISDIIGYHGYINVDFADVKTMMRGMGDAIMGIGMASGENRAIEAAKNALNSPLLDGISIKGSRGVLVNISGSMDLSMHEIAEAVTMIEESAGEDVNLKYGVVPNEDLKEEIMITIVATGFKKQEKESGIKVTGRSGVQQSLPIDQHHPAVSGGGLKPKPMPRPNPVARLNETKKFTEIYSQFDTSPKGEESLHQFDQPAFMRREAKYVGGNVKTIPAVERLNNSKPD